MYVCSFSKKKRQRRGFTESGGLKRSSYCGGESLEEETSETFVVFVSETRGLRHKGLGYTVLLNVNFKNSSTIPFMKELSDGV